MQPVVIGQIREARLTACIRTVAVGAISEEQTLTASFSPRGSIATRRCPGAGTCRRSDRTWLGRLHFGLVLADLRPAEQALEHAGIQRQIADPEHDRDVKQLEPPLGQRIVQLLRGPRPTRDPWSWLLAPCGRPSISIGLSHTKRTMPPPTKMMMYQFQKPLVKSAMLLVSGRTRGRRVIVFQRQARGLVKSRLALSRSRPRR